jgi:hypothetical protein
VIALADGKPAVGISGAARHVSHWPRSSAIPPLGAFLTAPRLARVLAADTLAAWSMTGLAEPVGLVVSELVTNAVRASSGPDGCPLYVGGRMPVVRVCLFTDGRCLLIEVWDQAHGVPTLRPAAGLDESGRGLPLVDAITGGRWGWHPVRKLPDKCVWAEMQVPPP